MRSSFSWLLVAVVAVAFSGTADARKKSRVSRVVTNCDKDEEGAPGEEDEFPHFREESLMFDPLAPPDYQTTFSEPPEPVPMSVTVLNATDMATDAIVEVTICALEEECISLGGDLGQWGTGMSLQPGERRTLLVWLEEPLSYGKHTVSFTLMDGSGNFADYHFGERIQVGESKVEMTDVVVDGQGLAKRKSNVIRMEDPERGVLMTVKVKNEGIAPEGVYAVFAINVDQDCIDEVYAPSRELDAPRDEDSRVEPVWVAPGTENVEVTGLWNRSNKVGQHTVSVLLFDQAGQLLGEQRGLRLRVR
jgi:hypothetical protein